MGEKTPQKEIKKLEDTVKEVLNNISGMESSRNTAVDAELSDLEDIVKGALTELTDLENNLLNIISPSLDNLNKDGNYLMAARRFQNAMKVALFDGTSKRDIKIYDEGFNFYNSALELISATGNQSEIDQVKTEFAHALIKIITKTKNTNDPEFEPFAFRACKSLAEIYDCFKQFKVSAEFHVRTGDLKSDNPLIAELEYFQAVLDLILLKNMKAAKEYSAKLKLKHIKNMANELIRAVDQIKPELVEQVQNKIEVLAAQRRLNAKNVVYLLDLIKKKLEKPIDASSVELIQIPTEATPLSEEKISAIKESLTKGIQKLQTAHPNVKFPVNAQIDTSELISELKDVISSEISKEIKSLSNEIVSKILSSLPRGSGMSSRPRSAGTISDEDMPEIEMIEGGPREKPKRPKLDDMLDSVIVSE